MTLPAAQARSLLDAWDRQQSAYVAHREQRFTVMLETLRLHLGREDFTVLDLACGPGAISDRVLSAFPWARTVAVDYDPILLGVARGALETHGDRAAVHDADLTDPAWTGLLGNTEIDAILSSTALHWLSPVHLLGVYEACARLLRPGGLLMNADHLRYGDEHPTLRRLSEHHDRATQQAGFAAGALDYAAWYAEAVSHPDLAGLAAERERRFADRPPQPDASLAFHLSSLRTAGFTEAGTVWQYHDDFVVLGRR